MLQGVAAPRSVPPLHDCCAGWGHDDTGACSSSCLVANSVCLCLVANSVCLLYCLASCCAGPAASQLLHTTPDIKSAQPGAAVQSLWLWMQALRLSEEQQERLLQMRQNHLKQLKEVYIQRQALNLKVQT